MPNLPQIYNFKHCRFAVDEIEELLAKLNPQDLDFAPPPTKKAKLDELSAGPSKTNANETISLTEFLTTPHAKTRYNLVEASFSVFDMKSKVLRAILSF